MIVLRAKPAGFDPDWKPLLQRLPPPPRLTVQFSSWAGDYWPITHSSSRVYALQGAMGLGMGAPTHLLTERLQGGSRWEGVIDPSGEIHIPMRVDGRTLEEFLDVRKKFKRALDPSKESMLIVVTPDGTPRFMPVRYKSGGDAGMRLDPHLTYSETFPDLTFLTAEPYWLSDTRLWTAYGLPAYPPNWQPPPIPQPGGDGSGNPGGGGSSSTSPQYGFFPGPPWRAPTGQTPTVPTTPTTPTTPTGPGEDGYTPAPIPQSPQFPLGVFVNNDGDVPEASYPKWKVLAPYTGFRVGVGENVVEIRHTKTGGWIEVDTDPRMQTIRDEQGNDLPDDAIVEIDFAPIPPGETPLNIAIFGTTQGAGVELRYRARYREAW